MNNLSNAYTEVLVILSNMDNGIYSIPYNVLETLKRECNLNHKFKLMENFPLSKQKLLEETKVILSIFYKEYWAENKKIIK